MRDKEFIEKALIVLSQIETFEESEGFIKDCIQFGRENPETCKMEINDDLYLICNECNSLEHIIRPFNKPWHFCPYCGRKIIFE